MDQEPAPKSADTASKPKMPLEQQPTGRIDRLKGFLGNLTKRHPQPAEEIGEEKIPFPHGEIALKAFKKEFGNDPDKAAMMGRIIDTFFRQEMDNTAIFTDPQGASLPYTKINVTELARAVANIPKPDQPQGQAPEHHRFFITPSFPALQNGHQFTFVEVALKQTMKYLPGAVEDLKAGKVPQDIEIFTVGSPTNKKWGQVTQGYVGKLHGDAYRTLGDTYSKLAETQLPQSPAERAKTSIVFFGQSESASLAESAAERSIYRGTATQDALLRKNGLPYVQVIMDAPVALNPSTNRRGEIVRGFAFDAALSGLTSSHARKAVMGEAGFLDKVANVLNKKGIETHESEREIKLKTEGKNVVKDAMYTARMPVDALKLKVNIRRGTQDRTIPQREFARLAKDKISAYPKGQPAPIGKFLVKDDQLDVVNNDRSGRVREAAIRGTHIFSVTFPKHEVQKWGVGVDRIQRAISKTA